MTIPAWKVLSWAPVPTEIRDWERSVKRLRHLGTSVHLGGDPGVQEYGQVLWGLGPSCAMVGIAWDWVRLKGDVVVMADPMTVVSNVELVDASGQILSDGDRLLCLNAAIYRLPWQQRVCAESLTWHPPLAA